MFEKLMESKLSKSQSLFLGRKEIVIDLIKKLCPQDAVGVEIGVYKGEMSQALLDECSVRHLYLIDPYVSGYSNFNESPDSKQKDMNKRYKTVSKFFAKRYPDKATFIRKKSEDAHSDVPDDLDFLYIDGNHAHEYVLRDLNTWVPKLKSGGLVIGDDWASGFPGVITAVQEYCQSSTLLQPPFESYKGFDFIKTHVRAPGRGKAIVNKCQHTWWSVRV